MSGPKDPYFHPNKVKQELQVSRPHFNFFAKGGISLSGQQGSANHQDLQTIFTVLSALCCFFVLFFYLVETVLRV